MRKFLKNKTLNIFKTLYEAHADIKKYIDENDYESAGIILNDCQNTAIQLGTVIEQSEGEGHNTVSCLEEYCEALYEVSVSLDGQYKGSKAQKSLNKVLIRAENSAKSDIKTRLEIVFMPYKVSMWDSLESIWRAAESDPDCDAYVVAIPYYERNPDGSLGKFIYEGCDYPDYVPVINYETYDLSTHKPDVIYIHNPYDEYNYVTSVDPRFYSAELKKNTPMLVYVPYFIAGYYGSVSSVQKHIFSCYNNADVIIMQSDKHAELYRLNGLPSEKMAVLGNPKSDYVINVLPDTKVPQEWLDIIQDKPVILMNSSISRVLNTIDWVNFIKTYISNIMREAPQIALIWRPHPLIKASISSMHPSEKAAYGRVMSEISSIKNVIIDESSLAYPAMKISDGMISDYSSLIMQYTLTGKPVYIVEGNLNKNSKQVCFDYFLNYSPADETEKINTIDFINMVCSHNDTRREKRLEAARSSIKNSDGTCGQKIHEYICKRTGR